MRSVAKSVGVVYMCCWREMVGSVRLGTLRGRVVPLRGVIGLGLCCIGGPRCVGADFLMLSAE